jgi:hypothetical protein
LDVLYLFFKMYTPVPLPIACGLVGALAGLMGGGFTNCFPVWVGTAAGSSLGCALCIVTALMPERATPLPVAAVAEREPVIIQNIYIINDKSGEVKC